MLIFTLKKEWYEKIKNGEKTIEYREVKPYWEKRILPFFSPSTMFMVYKYHIGAIVQVRKRQ